MLRLGGRRHKAHERVCKCFTHFPGERILGVHQIIKEACEPLSNPTFSFGRFMHFRPNGIQIFSVHSSLPEKLAQQEIGSVQRGQLESQKQIWGGGAGGENWFSYSQSWVSLPHLIASSMLHLPVYKLPYVQLIKSVIHKELIFNKWSVIFYIKRISTQLSKPETWAASLAPSTLFPNIQSVNLPCALPQVPLKLFPSPHPGHHHLCL